MSVLTIRFESIKGTPASYHSDNGTNFVGAVYELEDCLRRLDQSKITDQLGQRGVTWNFNPPAAPHFGAAWERLVRSAKRALQFVLRQQTLTDEILATALKQVQCLLNGRPLTHVSINPDDPEALTPNHLLIGRSNPTIAPDVFDKHDMSMTKRWRFAQALATWFWRRWMREYVPNLIERRKWRVHGRNLKIGDIVLIVDPNTTRGEWPLGRITEVYSSKDGVVRSPSVRTTSNVLHRPVTKLCLMEAAESDSSVNNGVRPSRTQGWICYG